MPSTYKYPWATGSVADGALEKVDTLAYGHMMWHYNLNRPMPLYKLKVGWEGGE